MSAQEILPHLLMITIFTLFIIVWLMWSKNVSPLSENREPLHCYLNFIFCFCEQEHRFASIRLLSVTAWTTVSTVQTRTLSFVRYFLRSPRQQQQHLSLIRHFTRCQFYRHILTPTKSLTLNYYKLAQWSLLEPKS